MTTTVIGASAAYEAASVERTVFAIAPPIVNVTGVAEAITVVPSALKRVGVTVVDLPEVAPATPRTGQLYSPTVASAPDVTLHVTDETIVVSAETAFTYREPSTAALPFASERKTDSGVVPVTPEIAFASIYGEAPV